ncbi:hypothetical protein KEM54_004524 [Ascosphaera aggregata]|nr:hypothetical protein KEM54_004524 [Ascosphaera aggregata]
MPLTQQQRQPPSKPLRPTISSSFSRNIISASSSSSSSIDRNNHPKPLLPKLASHLAAQSNSLSTQSNKRSRSTVGGSSSASAVGVKEASNHNVSRPSTPRKSAASVVAGNNVSRSSAASSSIANGNGNAKNPVIAPRLAASKSAANAASTMKGKPVSRASTPRLSIATANAAASLPSPSPVSGGPGGTGRAKSSIGAANSHNTPPSRPGTAASNAASPPNYRRPTMSSNRGGPQSIVGGVIPHLPVMPRSPSSVINGSEPNINNSSGQSASRSTPSYHRHRSSSSFASLNAAAAVPVTTSDEQQQQQRPYLHPAKKSLAGEETAHANVTNGIYSIANNFSNSNTSRPASSAGTGSSIGSPSPMFFHADDARSSLSSMQDDGAIAAATAAIGCGGLASHHAGMPPQFSTMGTNSSFFRADDARSVMSGSGSVIGTGNGSGSGINGDGRPRLPSGTVKHRPSPLLPTASSSRPSLSGFVHADGKAVHSASSSGFFRADGSVLEEDEDDENSDTRNPVANPRPMGSRGGSRCGSIVGGGVGAISRYVDNSDTLSALSIGSSARLGFTPHIGQFPHYLSQHIHHHLPQHHPNGISPMVPPHGRSASIDAAISISSSLTATSTAAAAAARTARLQGRRTSNSIGAASYIPERMIMPAVIPHSPLSPQSTNGNRPSHSNAPTSPTPLSPALSAGSLLEAQAPIMPHSFRGVSGNGERELFGGLARIASSSHVADEAAAAATIADNAERDEDEEKETSNQHLKRMNELAKSSREQRKVLDLEISNNSLLAINRALERKLRRQNAEIRRFRRLSRSGNLSKIADEVELRRGKQRGTDGDEEDGEDDGYSTEDLSMLSEEDYTDSNSSGSDHSDSSRHHRRKHGEDGDDDEQADAKTPDSNAAPSDSNSRRAQKDTHRLIHDLSKHQQLLISSQKLDESIKRCLGRAEALLEEANRSLEYCVGPSEVRGRVLNSDEVGGPSSGGKGLLSSLVDVPIENNGDDEDKETETEVEIETDVSVMG